MVTGQTTQTSRKKIDAFYVKRDTIKSQIKDYQSQIKNHQSQISLYTVEISRLEGELVQIRPRIGNGQKLCEICDVISMVFDGFESEEDYCYKCPNCGHEDYGRPEN